MQSFKNGNVTVSDTTVQVKGLLGASEVIQKHQIQGIQAVGNMFWGIINVVTVLGIYKGVKMLRGNKLVIIKKTYGEDCSFWMHRSEVKKFKSSI